MLLFLEMLWVTKCRNLSVSRWEYFTITGNIFLMPKNWNYFFYSSAFVDEKIRGKIIYDLFNHLFFNMGKHLLKKKGPRKLFCLMALVIYLSSCG